MGRDALNSKQEMLKDEDLVCLARTNIFFFGPMRSIPSLWARKSSINHFTLNPVSMNLW